MILQTSNSDNVNADEKVHEYLRTHGMNRLRPHFDAMQKALSDQSTKVAMDKMNATAPWKNDFIMAATHGINNCIESLKKTMDTFSIIAALLLSFAAPLAMDPPDNIGDLDNGSALKICFLVFTTILVSACIMIIFFHLLFSISINKAVRDSDKWMIILKASLLGRPTDIVIVLMIIVSLALFGVFGSAVAASFGTVATISCTIPMFIAWLHAHHIGKKFMDAGHVNFYWIARGPKAGDPVDIAVPMLALEKVIERAEQWHTGRANVEVSRTL